MRHPLLTSAALLLTALAAAPALADTAASLTDLGTLWEANSWAYGISADGSVVAGMSYTTGDAERHAFRWTQSGGMADLGTLGGNFSDAFAVSADGSTVVGSNAEQHAFRWTASSGTVDLGTLGGYESYPFAVSADGSVVVGMSYTGNAHQHAFRWTQSAGMADLGTLGGTNSWAYGVSADGSTVVGDSRIAGNSADHAFRWTQSAGMVDLGTLGGTGSRANGISADGSVVAGYSSIAGNSATHAFRWTQSAGMADLGTLGGTGSGANGISADGSVVVGEAYTTGDSASHAFRWTQSAGMQDLNTLLADAGVNMAGVTLWEAEAISGNGKYIVGARYLGDEDDEEERAFLVLYDDSYTPPGSVEPEPVAGITSGAAQVESAEKLADKRRAMLAQSRASANELLGMARPFDRGTYVAVGGMFGSVMGTVAGQASRGGLTALGGLGWGAQGYGGGIEQDNALTFAGALRYTLDKPFFGGRVALSPYAELGGWMTPEETLTFSRTYANGSGATTGQGSAEASSFAGYARGGLVWDVSPKDKLVGYGEFGRQYLSVSSYVETYGPRNPFPAEVNGGLLSMDVAKIGGQWTHEVGNAFLSSSGNATPISLTLAGAAARSFNARMSLSATLAGAGTVTTASRSDTWGEFAARASAQVAKNLSLGLGISAIAGPDPVGASVHGGASLTYGF